MLSYQISRVAYTPGREVLLSGNGGLLLSSEARYDSLDEYVLQFASPLSILKTTEMAFYQFSDPITPGVTLLVLCYPDLRQTIRIFLEPPNRSRRLRPALRRELRRTQDAITRVRVRTGGWQGRGDR